MPKLMQNMTEGELEAVEADKALWLEARKMYKNWGKRQLLFWLENHSDITHREDMRRRLNIIRTNNSRKRK